MKRHLKYLEKGLRLLLFFSFHFSLFSLSAQTIGDAFYIYRNDGQFNAFFRSEVDSMAYSCYDADSTYHSDYVTQLIYTQDSTYVIPLDAIDSLSFVQPENILKPSVKSLTGSLLDYLVKWENQYLYFLTSIPPSLMPENGDKLVTIEMTDLFPCGFAGRVIGIENRDGFILIECEGLDLEDVYESYCYTVDFSPEAPSQVGPRRAPIDKTIKIPKLSHSWSVGAGYSIFNVNNTVETSLTPTFHIKGTDMVDPKKGRLTNIRVTGNYTTGLKYDFGFEVSPSPLDYPFPGGRGERPIAPLLSFFWDFGMFVGVSGSVTFSRTFTHHYVSHIDYQRQGIKIPKIDFDRPELVGHEESEARIALNGSVRGGFYGEIGVKPWLLDKNAIGKVSGRLEVGIEAEMERGLTLQSLREADKNTVLYDIIDNAGDLTLPSITISPYASVNLTIQVGPWNEHWIPWKGKIGSPLYQGGYFPHFSNTDYERTAQSGSIKFTSDLSRTCLFPYQIGFTVFDMQDNLVKTEYYDRDYHTPDDFDNYVVTISGLESDKQYKVYPSINVFDHPVLASPYVIVRTCPVKLSDFKVTKSQHQENGFTNDGIKYDYRFDVSVTATLDTDDTDEIQDWGYVYLDPNGREKEISLKTHGTSYTDTNYAYFRNGTPPFTCTLYGYVKYIGSDETVYGEPHDYPLEYGETTCPDGNHPHWIDMGLPSGTQWRCCNEGASSPEAYGGYYTFGQVSSAPTLEQIRELLNYCTSEWTTVNGVIGRKFTGPNGGTIFLPAAGDVWGGELYSVGSLGFYWSSTPNDSVGAYDLRFYSGGALWGDFRRGDGQSVRPVR